MPDIGQIVRSMFHTNARKPNCSVSKSIICKVSNNGSTLLSSTIVKIAEHILGQAWLPKCGSPVFEPRPCTLYCVFAGTGIKNRRRKLRRQRELDVYFQANKDSIIKK